MTLEGLTGRAGQSRAGLGVAGQGWAGLGGAGWGPTAHGLASKSDFAIIFTLLRTHGYGQKFSYKFPIPLHVSVCRNKGFKGADKVRFRDMVVA